MRILVDQSGYDLQNIGDVAMLQSCVIRLRQQWPDAEIMVIAHNPDRLDLLCHNVVPVGPSFANRPFLRHIPRKSRLASEQIWKSAAPYLSGRVGRARRPLAGSCTPIQAVQRADVVVASGGGYVTDTWWWHGTGVLSLLSLAQRLGKPTAMFGQGIGPIRQRALRMQAREVLPKLAVIGLRESRIGLDLALSLGVAPSAVTITGDDALELFGEAKISSGKALGVNLRISRYAGVDLAAAATVGDLMLEAASAFRAPIMALPVSRYAKDQDLGAIRETLHWAANRTNITLCDLETPHELAVAAADCRTIITGSYHAAVFGLGQGVPAVCISRSSYYDAKFGGLNALFPGACFTVSLDRPDFAGDLRSAIHRAWHLPDPARADARAIAARLNSAGRDAYAQFRHAVERTALPTATEDIPHDLGGQRDVRSG